MPLDKSQGREDNLMYKVSEGYNLNKNDKTYFDKFNVMDLFSAGRGMNTSASAYS